MTEGSDTLAHDLRSPLTSIVSYVDLVRAGGAGALTDDQEAMLAVVARNADRLMRLLDDHFPSGSPPQHRTAKVHDRAPESAPASDHGP
ncbi:MAG: histidine kinase dimerization/phospho-acceptor domain-containing protein [Frankia sp.]